MPSALKGAWIGLTALATAAVLVGGIWLVSDPQMLAAKPEHLRVRMVDVTATSSAPSPFAANYRRPGSVPYPADNDFTPDREYLGKVLFFDPRLSGSNFISCATCHNPAFSWGDGLPNAIGHGMQELGRRTPTIVNLAWADTLFWDGRASSLEEQALGPVEAAGEMNQDLAALVSEIHAIPGYKPLFERAYPGEPISEATIAKAIATFERGIVSGIAPFDEWITGNEAAISPSAKRGFEVFNTTGNCFKCHSGWNFTDGSFHDIGVAGDDPGRGTLLPNVAAMRSAFKTPTLRNVALRAPYMHNGSERSLEQVVESYDVGGRVKRESLSPEIQPLNLSDQDKRDLVEFLKTLTSRDRPVEIPVLPPN